MKYSPVQQPRLADVIVGQLESMILEGSLPPGQKLLPERELARQFDVSRPSVREAMQKLEAKGLIERRQGGGNFVSDQLWDGLADPMLNLLCSNPDSSFDLLEFRYALESIAAYYAALRGTEADCENLRQHFAAMESAISQSVAEQAKTVADFFLAITEASHNRVLLHAVRALKNLLTESIEANLVALSLNQGQSRSAEQQSEIIQQIQHYRSQLLAAILSREPEAARQASHEHLAFIEDALLSSAQEQSRAQRSLRRLQQAGANNRHSEHSRKPTKQGSTHG